MMLFDLTDAPFLSFSKSTSTLSFCTVTTTFFSGSALPKSNWYSNIELILLAVFLGPRSVKPINAGIAVSTSATEGGKREISSTYTPGVLYVFAILKNLVYEFIYEK